MQENRRVRMTKRCMKDALLELLENAPLNKISVTDVCIAADVNRSTFYSYYNDIDELLTEIETEVLEQIPVNVNPEDIDYEGNFLDKLEIFFNYIQSNEKIFRILMIKSGEHGFNTKVTSFILEHYKNATLIDNELLSRYGCIYCISGVIGMVKEWIQDRFPINYKQFAKLVLQMSIQAIEIEN
ncbi:MAG: TetR family transcriptional regulator C-terminal domain-containing protein [Clostridia bacterium]|nr:TetR family transcriptional regulator C-terminal domain-containing protein [Clostridia bacterium]